MRLSSPRLSLEAIAKLEASHSVFPAERVPDSDYRVFTFEDARPAPPAAPAAPSGPDPREVAELHARAVATAEQRGYERGRAEGRVELEREVSRLKEQLQGAIGALHGALERMEADAVTDSARLGLMVGEKLARRALEVDPMALEAMIESAAEHLEEDPRMKVTAEPALAAQVRALVQPLTQRLGLDELVVQEDPRLEPGDLVVHRGSTTLDARIRARLARVQEALVRELGLELEGLDGTAGRGQSEGEAL